jgi:APA family basic amino acid/polyamine antiporter
MTPARPVAPILWFRRAQEPPTVWSPLDSFLYNLMTTNVVVFFGVPFIAGAAFYYPLGSLMLSIVIAGSFCLLEALVYAFLVSTMPRNGGDYTFQSRLLGGVVGATFAFTGVIVGGALWMGIAGWFASRIAVGPIVVVAGHGLHVHAMVVVGDWIMSTAGVVVMGLVAIAWSALDTSWSMRWYARFQRVLMTVGLVAIVVLVGYFALTRLSVNVSTYRAILYKAVEDGYMRHGHASGWAAVSSLLPVVAFGLIYPGWVAFQSAEVRRAGEFRVQLSTIVGAKFIAVIFALVVLPLPVKHVGEELFGASVYLALHDPASFWELLPRLFGLPAAPWLSYVGLTCLALAVNAWFWAWVPNHTLAASRVILAMSWDHLLPPWFARLHPRHGTPVRAVAVFSGLSCLVVLTYSSLGVWRLALHATLVNLISFAVTCLAAALFPFVRREQYRESTAAPFELLRVPLVSIAGVAFLAFAGFLVSRYIDYNGPSGELGLTDTLAFLVPLYALTVCLYVVSRRYRRGHEGADIEVYYREPSPAPADVRPSSAAMAANARRWSAETSKSRATGSVDSLTTTTSADRSR